MKIKSLLLLVLLFSISIFSQDSVQTFLSLTNTGVAEFHQLYPEYDGRGTIVLILDTGVDQGIDGLTKTSTGEVKVIDVQDFTGQGDVQLYEADIDEEDDKKFFVNEDMDLKVFGADKLTYHSVDDEYYIGAFDEARLINSSSGAADLNGNGRTDDMYMIIAFKTMVEDGQFWIAFFDTDGDGDISDEFYVTDYKISQQSFSIVNKEGLTPLTFGLNIFPEEKRISLHFDDGAHGTHCAGIAAGNNIGGTGLTGVAPGAYLISCKLGNNTYSDGASVTESMKQAYLYADRLSREREEPCIINMSFGIGSEIEGRSDMEKFLAELLRENPYLYVCTSSGNSGPGISTIGLPSSSEYVLSSGAILPQELGRDLYSTNLNRDIILHFSSRGGEVGKPDVCSPGACTSTVPNWETGDRYWGTSMASPYSAGVVSLLMSAMGSEFPGVKIPSQLVFTAIRESAKKMEGHSYLDQGSGYINVMEAYKLLNKYVDAGEVKKLETYTITSTAPNMPDGKAPNLYLRDGSFLTGNEKFNFTVRRNNFQGVDKFYRDYVVKCDEDWLIPVQKKTYIRNDQSATITVKFDKTKMTEPGLYSGKIKVYRNDKSKFPEFEMLATVVMPYHFSSGNNYEMNWADKKIEWGDIDRYFIRLPGGQTSMKISLTRNQNEYSMTRFKLFDTDGRSIKGYSSVLYSVDNETLVEKIYYNLSPGIYEVDVEGYFRAESISQYNLGIEFYGVNRLDDKVLSNNNNTVTVMNTFNSADKYSISGYIIGYKSTSTVELKGKEHYKYSFNFNPGESSKTFKLNLSKEDFSKLTDFAVLILDEEGVAVKSTAFSYKEESISVTNSSGSENTKYTLELIPGFAHKTGEMTIEITEDTKFASSRNMNITFAGKDNLTLYPNIPVELNCEFYDVNQVIPENANMYGKVYFNCAASNEIEAEIPVSFDLSN
ncbi:S8 family serine peptidase [Bacteroidota bacterium]